MAWWVEANRYNRDPFICFFPPTFSTIAFLLAVSTLAIGFGCGFGYHAGPF